MRLELARCAMRFGDRVLFEDLWVTARSGELTALTGPSGSGKTTLLGILAGFVRPTAGVPVLVDGAARMPMRPSFGVWVPQGGNALVARTVLDNAMLGALANGASRERATESAHEKLRRVGLAALAEGTTSRLSGGELQRLAIARALAAERPILFADEPTASLDRVNSLSVIDLLRTVVERHQVAAVVATHDRDVAARCTTVVSVGGP